MVHVSAMLHRIRYAIGTTCTDAPWHIRIQWWPPSTFSVTTLSTQWPSHLWVWPSCYYFMTTLNVTLSKNFGTKSHVHWPPHWYRLGGLVLCGVHLCDWIHNSKKSLKVDERESSWFRIEQNFGPIIFIPTISLSCNFFFFFFFWVQSIRK